VRARRGTDSIKAWQLHTASQFTLLSLSKSFLEREALRIDDRRRRTEFAPVRWFADGATVPEHFFCVFENLFTSKRSSYPPHSISGLDFCILRLNDSRSTKTQPDQNLYLNNEEGERAYRWVWSGDLRWITKKFQRFFESLWSMDRYFSSFLFSDLRVLAFCYWPLCILRSIFGFIFMLLCESVVLEPWISWICYDPVTNSSDDYGSNFAFWWFFEELTVESCGFALEVDWIGDEFGGIVLVLDDSGVS
jgi:hypothetical protein